MKTAPLPIVTLTAAARIIQAIHRGDNLSGRPRPLASQHFCYISLTRERPIAGWKVRTGMKQRKPGRGALRMPDAENDKSGLEALVSVRNG